MRALRLILSLLGSGRDGLSDFHAANPIGYIDCLLRVLSQDLLFESN